MIKFTHLRKYNELGELAKFGGATIAYSINTDVNLVFAAISFCHPEDHFCKTAGRNSAKGILLADDGNFTLSLTQHEISSFACKAFKINNLVHPDSLSISNMTEFLIREAVIHYFSKKLKRKFNQLAQVSYS